MHRVNGSTSTRYSIGKVLLLIRFLIDFKVDFSQAFFTSAGNIATSSKFMGSDMKLDTFDPDYPKPDNDFF